MFRGRIRSIHLVGIGGVGMSGIAEVLLGHGFAVTGSDLRQGDATQRLASIGAKIFIGHQAEHIRDADVVVCSSAVAKDNPEVLAAHARSIPVIPRAEMLAELMRLRDGIAIAGSHGKTTTTSLVATILQKAGLDPTVIIGGKLNALGSGAAHGSGAFLVAEADESDGSFLHLTPTIAVITNIDREHLDYYPDHQAIKDTFVSFANRVPFYGLIVACLDHPHVQDILPRLEKRVVTYGLSTQAQYRARHVRLGAFSSHFEWIRYGEPMGEVSVRMPGMHNVQNALAAIAVADEVHVPYEIMADALANFGGVERRFTLVGQVRGISVIDDYGHHPAEIEATLAAAQNAFSGKVFVVFQPHRYSRTQHLMEDLSRSFNKADVVFIADIYPAGEKPIAGVSAQHLADAIRHHGHRQVRYIQNLDTLGSVLAPLLQRGDSVITLGAGNISKRAPEILAALNAMGTAHE